MCHFLIVFFLACISRRGTGFPCGGVPQDSIATPAAAALAAASVAEPAVALAAASVAQPAVALAAAAVAEPAVALAAASVAQPAVGIQCLARRCLL